MRPDSGDSTVCTLYVYNRIHHIFFSNEHMNCFQRINAYFFQKLTLLFYLLCPIHLMCCWNWIVGGHPFAMQLFGIHYCVFLFVDILI